MRDDIVFFKLVELRDCKETGVGSLISRDIYWSILKEVYDAYLYDEQKRVRQVRYDLYMIILKALHSLHLLVQSQQWKQQNNL